MSHRAVGRSVAKPPVPAGCFRDPSPHEYTTRRTACLPRLDRSGRRHVLPACERSDWSRLRTARRPRRYLQRGARHCRPGPGLADTVVGSLRAALVGVEVGKFPGGHRHESLSAAPGLLRGPGQRGQAAGRPGNAGCTCPRQCRTRQNGCPAGSAWMRQRCPPEPVSSSLATCSNTSADPARPPEGEGAHAAVTLSGGHPAPVTSQ